MKRQCKTFEELGEVLENFVASLGGGSPSASGTDHTEARTGKKIDNQAEDKLNSTFDSF